MNFNFDTASMTSREARGLAALLSVLFPDSAPVNTAAPEISNSAASPSHMAIIGAGMDRAEVEAVGMTLISGAGPTSTPEQASTGRKRRTKAEIAADADEAAAKQAVTGTTSDPTPASTSAPGADAEKPVSTQLNGAAGTTAVKPVSADELRALLNAYIQKHSMEDAIARLQEFGCNRVTEALALAPEKLNGLAKVLSE
jgi:hypothetical protein